MNGVDYATFSLYLTDTGSARTNVPYTVTLNNPGYTGISNYWNWEVSPPAPQTPLPKRYMPSKLCSSSGVLQTYMANATSPESGMINCQLLSRG